MNGKMTSVGALVSVYFALLALLGITLGTAFLDLGVLNVVLNLTIAFAKMLLIAFVFMELSRGIPLLKFVAGAGIYWLAILIGLSQMDFLSRNLLGIWGK